MVYVTLAVLKAYRGTTQTADDDILQDCLDSAQDEIERICGRAFEGSTGARYYRSDDLLPLPAVGGSGNVLWLGKDLLALGGLTNGDATTIASTDCWLEPRNRAPYQWIRLKSAESWSFGTDGEIVVSGTWGYSTIAPGVVAEATKELASYLYQLKAAPIYDVVASPEAGTITIPKGSPAHVKMVLDKAGLIRRRVLT